MKYLRWFGIALAVLAVGGAVWYPNRTDPVAMLAGRALSGEVANELIEDWSFADEHRLIKVETRPAAPHSVTTASLVFEGDLYVPAKSGSTKSWTQYALADARARLKIGDRVYPVSLARVRDEALIERLIAFAVKKTRAEVGRDMEIPEDVWVFKVQSRNPRDVAAAQD